jgi:aspartate kinase
LGSVAKANILVDMIIQNVSHASLTDFSFTIPRVDVKKAMPIIQDAAQGIGAKSVSVTEAIAKVSLVGVGMRSHSGVAAKMFEVLSQEGVNIMMISTSEIKISCVIDEKYLELAMRALHAAFGLDQAAAGGRAAK